MFLAAVDLNVCFAYLITVSVQALHVLSSFFSDGIIIIIINICYT